MDLNGIEEIVELIVNPMKDSDNMPKAEQEAQGDAS